MKNKRSLRQKMNGTITVITIFTISFLSAVNIGQFKMNVLDNILNSNFSELKDVINKSEGKLQSKFTYKKELIDVYGITQKILNKKILGNFEYVLDDNGIIHAIKENPYNTDQFVEQLGELKKRVEKKKIPFLYVQGANREIASSNVDLFNIDNATMDELVLRVKKEGIDVHDIREELKSKPHTFLYEDVFLHTDLHMQTDSEIWVANNLVEYFQDNYGMTISNKEYLTDMNYYTKKSYEMVGNYGRLVGSCYVPMDKFLLYFPEFETDYELDITSSGEHLEGDFESIIMNGYEKTNVDNYTYWVTDFLRYGEPLYTITNKKNPNGIKLLVFTDSIGYRTLSYLSLTVGQLTVVDPRFFGDVDYISKALEGDYDLALVYQGTFLTDYDFNIN